MPSTGASDLTEEDTDQGNSSSENGATSLGIKWAYPGDSKLGTSESEYGPHGCQQADS
ncbi:MAG: hypothetical protein NVSMB9_13990 [Isosphaeraceae bacterium]